jgi:hypothetical protein
MVLVALDERLDLLQKRRGRAVGGWPKRRKCNDDDDVRKKGLAPVPTEPLLCASMAAFYITY